MYQFLATAFPIVWIRSEKSLHLSFFYHSWQSIQDQSCLGWAVYTWFVASQNKSIRCTSKSSERLGRVGQARRSVTVPSRTCVGGVWILTNETCSMMGVLAQVVHEILSLTCKKLLAFTWSWFYFWLPLRWSDLSLKFRLWLGCFFQPSLTKHSSSRLSQIKDQKKAVWTDASP